MSANSAASDTLKVKEDEEVGQRPKSNIQEIHIKIEMNTVRDVNVQEAVNEKIAMIQSAIGVPSGKDDEEVPMSVNVESERNPGTTEILEKAEVLTQITDISEVPMDLAFNAQLENNPDLSQEIYLNDKKTSEITALGKTSPCKCNLVKDKEYHDLYCPTDRKPSVKAIPSKHSPITHEQRRPSTIEINTNERFCEVQIDENGLVRINWRRVKKYLRLSCPSKKLKLLQAIRWRITKATDERIQDKTLCDIRKYDILGINNEFGTRTLLEDLLWPLNVGIPHPVQDCAARLLNAIASTKIGREYLGQQTIISILVWGEHISTLPFEISDRDVVECHMAEMLIATMMKLSLSHCQRKDMVKKGLLRWLVNHLEDVEATGSYYHLEYGTALLMMLLTFQNSPELIFEKSRQILALLARFLNNKVTTCWPYIRASLLALLRNQKIVSIARTMDYPRLLKDISRSMRTKEEKMEIDSIVFCLESPAHAHLENIEKCVINLADDKIYLDEEIEAGDPVCSVKSPEGEEFLAMKFASRKCPVKEQLLRLRPHISRKDFIEDITLLPRQSYNETTHTFNNVPKRNNIFGRDSSFYNRYDSKSPKRNVLKTPTKLSVYGDRETQRKLSSIANINLKSLKTNDNDKLELQDSQNSGRDLEADKLQADTVVAEIHSNVESIHVKDDTKYQGSSIKNTELEAPAQKQDEDDIFKDFNLHKTNSRILTLNLPITQGVATHIYSDNNIKITATKVSGNNQSEPNQNIDFNFNICKEIESTGGGIRVLNIICNQNSTDKNIKCTVIETKDVAVCATELVNSISKSNSDA